ncbi:MAG TPA: hypothetical protein VG711_10445, partial [Phycisphaerales bacterium]|nr:hypothetical protein [Phycisphaerales bacterium]
MTTRNSASHSCPPRTASPRGNTLILVVGILVLLVIIATAYISRTQAGLVTSNATQDLKMRVDRNNVIASDLAQIIADALFVREISADGVNDIANGNTTNPRRSPIGP